MPDWPEHAIWWHVYPLGFTGAPQVALPDGAPAEHRLRQLEAWLPHLVELGCNGLLLGPVFAAQTHGYDTVDHFAVDRRLGTREDLDSLVAACRERGVRVLLDGVFNHVGRGFPAFQQLLREGRGSAAEQWFRVDWDADGPDGFGYADFEGHSALVALDHSAPVVAEHVVSVMRHWLDAGVDGWRLDAAYAVPPAFWRDVADQVRATHPQAWLVGEVIHGDYPAWLTESGLDSLTQYQLWKATWSALNDRNLFELAWAVGIHDELVGAGPEGGWWPMTFLGNHDVTRIASRLDDARHLGHALAVLVTLAGSPSVYAGDELAQTGVKEDREGGDDAVRPAFPPTPADIDPTAGPTLALHQELLALRRRHAWLAGARTTTVELTNEQYAYTTSADGGSLTVLLNLADDEHRFPAAGDATVEASSGGHDGDPWTVPAHGWSVLAPR
jgi:cyclomaltodextrinase / maltogenic alpha-amylase / neopullulanase